MTAAVIQRCETEADAHSLIETVRGASGVYHAAGSGETTWHGFAAEAVRLQQERNPELRLANIEPITTTEYPTPARRPANSRLDCSKLQQRFGWTMMDWHDSLRKVLSELKTSA